MPSSFVSTLTPRLSCFLLMFSMLPFFNSLKCPCIPFTSEVAILAMTVNTSGAISILPNWVCEVYEQ